MEIYTIGFTRKTARQFFETLRRHQIEHIIDVRLNNSSQLAGFAKKDDLQFFLHELCQASYTHMPLLAPTDNLLKTYRKTKDWAHYESSFLQLLADREVEKKIDSETFRRPTALLCSEATADQCHRRLVAEYFRDIWGDVSIVHL